MGGTGEGVEGGVLDQGRVLENQLLTGKITGFLEDEILLMEPFI